jgi:tetratricopeptide (TPR) repeat protein
MANRPELALPELQWVVRRQPGLYIALCNLGRAYRKLNLAHEGLPYLEKAIGLHPNRFEGKIALAESLVDLGRMDEAATLYREILARNPDLPEALGGLASTRKFKAGDPEIIEIEEVLAGGKSRSSICFITPPARSTTMSKITIEPMSTSKRVRRSPAKTSIWRIIRNGSTVSSILSLLSFSWNAGTHLDFQLKFPFLSSECRARARR